MKRKGSHLIYPLFRISTYILNAVESWPHAQGHAEGVIVLPIIQKAEESEI
jgi:hypothetical protein